MEGVGAFEGKIRIMQQQLNARPGPTTLLCVSGHKGMPGKEPADTEAKAAVTTINGLPRPIAYACARSLIRRTLVESPPANSRTVEVVVVVQQQRCKAGSPGLKIAWP